MMLYVLLPEIFIILLQINKKRSYHCKLGWSLEFGVWSLEFGFWILEFGWWLE